MVRLAALSIAILTVISTSALAETVFIGTIKFTGEAKDSKCEIKRTNQFVNSTFHPIIKGNQKFAGLSFVYTDSAFGHQLLGRNFDAKFRTVATGGVGWGDTFFVNPDQRAQIKVTSYNPPIGEINSSTASVTVIGQIKRFLRDGGGLNCTLNFIGTYVKDGRQ